MRFAEGVVSIVADRVPVLVGVGAPGTRETVELARHAEGVGADGVLVVTPFYWNVGEEALFAHFSAVARAVGIPVLFLDVESSLLPARPAPSTPASIGIGLYLDRVDAFGKASGGASQGAGGRPVVEPHHPPVEV